MTPGPDPTPDREIRDLVLTVWQRRFAGISEETDVRTRSASSLDLVDLELELRRCTGRAIHLDAIEGPITLDSVTSAARSASPSIATTHEDGPSDDSAPATAAQVEQWLYERLHPSSRAYLVPMLLPLGVETTWREAVAAMTAVVAAHPMLRTAVVEGEAGDRRIVQRIDPAPGIVLIEPRTVLRIDDDAVRMIIDGVGSSTPSVRSGRPYRVFGLQREGRLEALLLLLHHAVVDERSLRVLADDLGRRLQGRDPIPETLTIAGWARSQAMRELDATQLGWWRTRLSDCAVGLRLQRTHLTESMPHRRVVHLPVDTVQGLDREVARAESVRSAAVVQAVRRAIEHVGLAPEDVTTIGMPMSLREDPGLDRTVGMCLNTVPVPISANATLAEIASEIRSCRLRSGVPYDEIAGMASREGAARSPWLDVVVGIVENDRGLEPTIEYRVGPTLESPFPLLVVARFARTGCEIEFAADRRWIDDRTFDAFVGSIHAHLRRLATDAPLETSIVSGPVRTRAFGNLAAIVRDRATIDGDRPAVEAVDGSITTYAELDAASDALARTLCPAGASIDEPIAIVSEPGVAFCVAVLAAWKVGGAAMPLSPDLPDQRISKLLDVASISRTVVGSPEIGSRIDALVGEGVSIPIPTTSDIASPQTPIPSDPDSACYVLFTSGSTGVPKAVVMRHGGLYGLVEHEIDRLGGESGLRTAQCAPVGFDVVFQELLVTWATGGVVVPLSRDVRRDPKRLVEEIDHRAIARIHLPPLMLRALAAAREHGFPDSLLEIVCAGEQLRIDDSVRRAARHSRDGVRILNQYGPTETHVVTSADLGDDPDRWPDLPSIGDAVHGVEIRILDGRDEAVSPGSTGELVVFGDALALGYLDGRTGGFVEIEGRPAYRTGDLARLREDGVLEFLGRADEQLKISGYRVEPGEIEATLVQDAGVREAAVVAVSVSGRDRLVAFVVADGDEATVQERCSSTCRVGLPTWMRPSAVWVVDTLPRSANGKIDRTILRSWAVDRGVEHGHSDVVLSIPRMVELVGAEQIESDLAERPLATLGLDSLAAIRLQLALQDAFELEVPVAELLSTTLGKLRSPGVSGHVATSSPSSRESAPPFDPDGWHPLDPLARDVLAEDALSRDGAFHLAWRIDFDAEVPIEDLESRANRVRTRYATLRTCRRADLGEMVLPPDVDSVRIDRFDGEPDREDLEWLLRHRLSVAEGSPWRLATWPRVDGGRTLLAVIHHVAVDGRTASAVTDELAGGAGSTSDPVTIPSSGGQSKIDEHERWWIERLRNTLGNQSLERTDEARGDALEIETSAEVATVVERSMAVATGSGMPPIVPSVVAWGILLARDNARARAVVGVPFATDVDDAGFGTSILPVVVDASRDRDLVEVVSEVAQTIGRGLDHRHASLGRIVRALEPGTSFLRPPLDGVLTQDDAERRVGSARIRWCSTGTSVFRAGLMIPKSGASSPVVLEIERSRLHGESSAGLLARFATLLERICDRMESDSSTIGSIDDRPSSSVDLIEAFGAAESGAPPRTVVERFDEVVAARPDSVAVLDSEDRVDYRALQAWSNRIAVALVEACGPLAGRSVALTGGRSAAMVASMLAVARAGGVFVPIDSALPEERRRRQLEQASVVAVIGAPRTSTEIVDPLPVLDPGSMRDGSDPSLDSMPTVSADDPFYVMFTSGTTGEPRGAVIPNRAVTRLVDDPWFLPAGPGFRMLHAAPLAFDASTLEIWWPLLNGGTVCCWERSAAELPALLEWVRRMEVEGCWLTAALFHAAVDGLPEFFDGLDLVLTGGDVVSADHVSRLLQRRPGIGVVNGYGPTENTVFTACEPLVRGGFSSRAPLPIGRPVRGTGVRIVDPDGRSTPFGRFGELVATGAGVGLGYLDQEGRPERRDGFDLDPSTGEPRYRTGDRVRWREDGRLEFSGRIDAQVKIGGRRIELTAVDAALREDPMVLDACVSVRTELGLSRLVGLVVLEHDAEFDVDRLRARLETRLPGWEVPSQIMPASEIPMTPNGKPDRGLVAAGFAPEARDATVLADVQGSDDELYAVVCRSIESITGRPIAGDGTSLLESGLDSLDLLRLAIDLESKVARPVHLSDVLEGGTPRAIADRIALDIEREDAKVVTLQPGASPASRSLYCIPGVGGTVFSFESVLPGLPSWLPVYGLPYPGTAGTTEPLRSVESLAGVFAQRIRETAPVSVLVGYSLGGFVAFETARELARDGQTPRVVVIDSIPAALPRKTSLASRLSSRREWKLRLRNVLPRAVVDRIEKAQGRPLQSLRSVVAAGFNAIRSYEPAPADVDVTVVRTAQTDFHAYRDSVDLGWSELARDVETVEIDCSHLEVFRAGSMDLSRTIRDVVKSTRRRSR